MSDIATKLNLSVKTVSTHKARIFEKMGLANQAELIRYAIRHRLVDDPTTPAERRRLRGYGRILLPHPRPRTYPAGPSGSDGRFQRAPMAARDVPRP